MLYDAQVRVYVETTAVDPQELLGWMRGQGRRWCGTTARYMPRTDHAAVCANTTTRARYRRWAPMA